MEKDRKLEEQKYIVMDVVFHASSLNYDWGSGNYQELKKITKWDGRQYVLVSRYALRYSILHWGNKLFPDRWKLAGPSEIHAGDNDVARLKTPKEAKKKGNEFLTEIFKNYPEFDLFGFMVAEKDSNNPAFTRTSPVKISHAISLTPTDIDTHTMANLDMKKRGGKSGSNPVSIEEKMDFYVYNITIDVNRIGKYLITEHGNEEIGDVKIDDKTAKQRIIDLVDIALNLKRDIKGRREDLSPWLVIIGKYTNGRYESFVDKISLDRKSHYKVKRKYVKDEEKGLLEIEEETEEGLMPLFKIDTSGMDEKNKPLLYFRKGFCDYAPKETFDEIEKKNEILENIKEFLAIEEKNQ